ncbi:50S ribosomal protein L25 [Planctopirus ephydatiae]|uniref:Large ribosomal subunit protein bL25 n=1 Tax=Planctopirus ephydatiae TaxID=2528019 RepID=A0A518GS94_9PLAN|nr:50S ribosomal protein L25 [Planctopirus ephydatiae]QDV31454.1 50S ribosomal protein L25 [Planctopirus ephydatiae]
MSADSKVSVKKRQKLGTAETRRLRLSGLVPGIVYGHKQEPQPVVVDETLIHPIVVSGHKVVDLDVEGVLEKAIIRDVQVDPFTRLIQHIDFMRVDPNERVTVDVAIELKGTAPGILSGGMLEHQLHSIKVDCLAYQIPDSIVVKVSDLQLGGVIHVNELEIPPGVHVQTQGELIVVHVVKVSTRELDLAAPGAAEPEVIGKKAGEAEADAAPAKKK